MELRLVNPDPRYSKVRLIEPAPLGYLHVPQRCELRSGLGQSCYRGRGRSL